MDALLHFPLRYEDESRLWRIADVAPGESVQIQVTVLSSRIVFRPRRTLIVEVEDDTGGAVLRYFYFKDAQKNAFAPGVKMRILGEARKSLAGLEFVHPRVRSGWMNPGELTRQPLVAVYPAASGISQLMLRRAVSQAIEFEMPAEWLPEKILATWGLTPLPYAIRLIHSPPSQSADEPTAQEIFRREGPAWDRIRLDELLAQQLAFRRARHLRVAEHACALVEISLTERLLKQLPFSLTAAQKKSWSEIQEDLTREAPMNRLLQGDVGSGKTVVAALAAAQAVASGYQVAIMAPTELLAEQIFKKFQEWLAPLGVSISLLKGAVPAAEKKKRLQAIEDGSVAIAVGTHALIQKGVQFAQLGLVIVDEQHRFGVGQRLALRALSSHEGRVAHVLGMSATPIPRSLAMTYLADLDVSIINERPSDRKKIITKLMSASRRDELIDRIKEFISSGGQAYWVCPVIESTKPSEESLEVERSLQAIETAEQWLRPIFGDQLAVLHGKMASQEKSEIMQRFVSSQAKLLLSTTVIEVGVDVPHATLMVIEHAERFGLAQLHQLRGRVGRGAAQSTCILLFEEPLSELAKERLKTLYETDDGFEIAKRDLAIRGPGEFLGLRQSGVPTLRYSDLELHAQWVDRAVALGAQIAQAQRSPKKLDALGVKQSDIDSLMSRWGYDEKAFLVNG